MKMIKKAMIGIMAAAAMFGYVGKANADDITKGRRGPTSFQVDERVIVSQSDNKVETLTNSTTVKYWNGKDAGIWAYANLPYKATSTGAHGFGDLTLAAGPRFTARHLNVLTYCAITLPTGNKGISSERVDKKIGSFATLDLSDRLAIDAAAEYNITGKNDSTKTNELYVGSVLEYKLSDKIKVAGGATYYSNKIKENTNLRFISRYTVSKKFHAELVIDKTIQATKVPKQVSASIYLRRNF